MSGLKRILTDKNTVTIIGVIVAIIVLYVGYNAKVNAAVQPEVYAYAKETISPGTKITENMVGETKIPPSMIPGEPIKEKGQIVGKYVVNDTVVPKGSLFYARSITDKNGLVDSIIYDKQEGYTLFYMSVSTETTYGNSIYPGNYIDLYLKATNKISDENDLNKTGKDRMMYGKLISNIKVLAVLDSAGRNVFANLDDIKAPSQMIFAVPDEYYIVLSKAKNLRGYDTTLIPVPTDESLKEEQGEIAVSSQELVDWINSVTIWTETTG